MVWLGSNAVKPAGLEAGLTTFDSQPFLL